MGCLDPNPRHAGGAIPKLEAAGIEVVIAEGNAAEACQTLLAPFAKAITRGLPYVRVKLAMTLDGYLADCDRTSRWITGPLAREWVQHQRLRADAVMVSAGTARIDNPSLQPHLADAPQKWRVIIDRSTPVSPTDRDEKTLVATEDLGYDGMHLEAPLRALCQRGINEVFCEGGGQLAAALLDQGLVDELILIYAPKLLGDIAAVRGLPVAPRRLSEAMQFEVVERILLGEDTLVRLTPKQL
jgi:diaminohydroxyphosphoribosylaminopyrimidine deaminase/5-amino-6-(5-phosphoribosylamino)uracil reductase